VKQYEALYREDKVKAINDFTKKLESEMSKYIVIIKNRENDMLMEGIEEIYMNQWLKDKKVDVRKLSNQYEASREIVNMLNFINERKPEWINSLREKVAVYRKNLHQHGLRDHLLREDNVSKMNVVTFIKEYIIIYIGMPIYAVGLLMNYLPYYLAKIYTNKNIKKNEFKASVYANISMMMWVVYYFIQLILIGLIFNNWKIFLIYAVIVPLSTKYVLEFYPMMKKIFGRWRLLRMVRKNRDTVQQLFYERAAIIDELELAKKEYVSFSN